VSEPAGAVDLRSDTLTIPDSGMRAAMAAAEVGDDVWGEDPTVHRLEEEIAARLGKESAVFVPSGTMGNLASVAAQARPGDEVIADAQAHLALSEAGGTAAIAGVQLRLLDGFEGVPDAAMVGDAVRAENIHHPVSRLLCVENTHNRRGGAAISPDRIREAAAAAHAFGLRVHCDGARLFNAAIALNCSPAELVDTCDTVSVCMSKGLGAPVGSVVAGDDATVSEVRRWRKRLGGGMRQAGVIAAGALYALEHNVARLAEDHANALVMINSLRDAPGVRLSVPTVPTNIVLIETGPQAGEVAHTCAERDVLVTIMGPHTIRCVMHLGIDERQVRRAVDVLSAVLSAVQ
jgi:threonine aldolase